MDSIRTLSEDRIKREFYTTDVVDLAKKLLGKKIVRKAGDKFTVCRIVETEAYKAPEDKACHAYGGKKTEKTKYFWQIGGNLYVYSIYGNNMCMNITASDADKPEAVLIRAVEPLRGIEIIKKLRKADTKKDTTSNLANLSNGPGKTGAALDIDKTFNAVDLCTSDKIFLVDDEDFKFEIGTSKRINIDYAEEWKNKLWRFYIKNNIFVSKVPKSK
jgi:DNA-3-methyladenine glycosylase